MKISSVYGLVRCLVVAGLRPIAYIATDWGLEVVFCIGPNVTVAGEIRPKIFERLPNEHQSAVGGGIEELPLHRLKVTHDLRRFNQVTDDRLQRWVINLRIAIS